MEVEILVELRLGFHEIADLVASSTPSCPPAARDGF